MFEFLLPFALGSLAARFVVVFLLDRQGWKYRQLSRLTTVAVWFAELGTLVVIGLLLMANGFNSNRWEVLVGVGFLSGAAAALVGCILSRE